VSGIYKNIKEMCNDIERQNLYAKIKEKSSLIFYSEMKQEWAREENLVCRILGSHGGEYEDGCLLGCSAV
jgi:hypothetical protein